jgi:hypothetical protein
MLASSFYHRPGKNLQPGVKREVRNAHRMGISRLSGVIFDLNQIPRKAHSFFYTFAVF